MVKELAPSSRISFHSIDLERYRLPGLVPPGHPALHPVNRGAVADCLGAALRLLPLPSPPPSRRVRRRVRHVSPPALLATRAVPRNVVAHAPQASGARPPGRSSPHASPQGPLELAAFRPPQCLPLVPPLLDCTLVYVALTYIPVGGLC